MYHNLRISFFWKWNGIYKEKKRKLFESLFKGEFSTFQIERFKENTDKRSSWPSDFYSRNFYLYEYNFSESLSHESRAGLLDRSKDHRF